MNNNYSPLSNLTDQEINNLTAFDYKGWREKFILSVLRIATVLGTVFVLLSFPSSVPAVRILFIALYGILLLVTLLPVPYSIRAYTLLLINFALGLNAILQRGPFLDGSLFLSTFVILAAILFDSRVDVFALLTSMATILIFAFLNQIGWFTPYSLRVPAPTISEWVLYWVDFSILGTAIVVALELFKDEFSHAIGQMQRTFQVFISDSAKLEAGVRERTEKLEIKTSQLRSTTIIARNMTETQNIPDLLETVVNSAAKKFGYYHVGLYLLDEKGKNAFLQAASSTFGKRLIGQGFYVEPDKRSPISVVSEQKKAYIASDPGGGAFFEDPNFPLTRSRLVMPLLVRGGVIGVLDLHSDQHQAFGPEDADILQSLADLTALSLDNARLVDETKALLVQLESYTALQTNETWSKFTSRHIAAYQYTPAGVRPVFSPSKADSSEDNLLIPLVLKGQNIGNLKLIRKGTDYGWSDKERELVQKIADQVALALENSRLVDEAQKSAQRDQMIANISSRVRETLDVESVIRTATMELRKVFDLKEAEISIGLPQAEPSRVRRNTSSLRLRRE